MENQEVTTGMSFAKLRAVAAAYEAKAARARYELARLEAEVPEDAIPKILVVAKDSTEAIDISKRLFPLDLFKVEYPATAVLSTSTHPVIIVCKGVDLDDDVMEGGEHAVHIRTLQDVLERRQSVFKNRVLLVQ